MQERLGFDNDIAALEKAIKKRRKDFRELESMLSDAQLSRDMAKVSPPDATVQTVQTQHTLHLQSELAKLEQRISEGRRKREKELSEYRQQVEEKKEFQEKVERRVSSTMPATT